jgi:hypothetical protein
MLLFPQEALLAILCVRLSIRLACVNTARDRIERVLIQQKYPGQDYMQPRRLAMRRRSAKDPCSWWISWPNELAPHYSEKPRLATGPSFSLADAAPPITRRRRTDLRHAHGRVRRSGARGPRSWACIKVVKLSYCDPINLRPQHIEHASINPQCSHSRTVTGFFDDPLFQPPEYFRARLTFEYSHFQKLCTFCEKPLAHHIFRRSATKNKYAAIFPLHAYSRIQPTI